MPAEPIWWKAELTFEGAVKAVRERLGTGLADLYLVRRYYTFSYPFPPSEVVEFLRLYYGPTNQAFASLDAGGRESLRQELEALWSAHDRAGVDCTTVFGEYQVIGVRA